MMSNSSNKFHQTWGTAFLPSPVVFMIDLSQSQSKLMYRGGKISLYVGMLQASRGRGGKQQQELISPNHKRRNFISSVDFPNLCLESRSLSAAVRGSLDSESSGGRIITGSL